ncbi:MAG: hypothetical protein P8077_08145, partial [Gammaproteobacteria bacterium]
VILWHHRIVAIISFLMIVLSGVALVFGIPKTYFYSSVIEVGSFVLPDASGNLGVRQYIEDTEQTRSRIERRFIAGELLALAAHSKADGANEHGEKLTSITDLPTFTVSAPLGSNVVEITTKGPVQKEEMLLGLLTRINEGLIQDHTKKLEDVRSQMLQIIEQQEVRVERLQSSLLGVHQEITLLKNKKENLLKEQAVVKSQIDRYGVALDRLRKQRAQAVTNRSGEYAVTALLLENEIFRVERLRDELEVRAVSGIPQQIAEVEKNLAVLEQEVVVAETDFRNAERMLARSRGKSASKEVVTSERLSERKAKAPETMALGHSQPFPELINLEPTRVVVLPHRSLKAASLSRGVALVLTVVFATAASMLMAFFAAFICRLRAEISEE